MSGARRKRVRERRRAKLGLPSLERPRRCLGLITESTTRDDLIARGCTPEGADEILAFMEKLGQERRGDAAERERRAMLGIQP